MALGIVTPMLEFFCPNFLRTCIHYLLPEVPHVGAFSHLGYGTGFLGSLTDRSLTRKTNPGPQKTGDKKLIENETLNWGPREPSQEHPV